MSVSTPILTTSSEICAVAAPPDAANARPATSVAASDFMVSSPLVLVKAWLLSRLCGCLLPGFGPARKAEGGEGPAGAISLWYAGQRRGERSQPRQRGDGDADGARGLGDHAQRPGI